MNQTGGNQFGSGGLGNGLNPSLSRTSANSANQSANPYVQFYPNGRCDVVTIEVTGQTGEKYLVSCPSATESFAVTKPGGN